MGKVTWANSYYGGPEHTDTNAGWRHFYDTALTINPMSDQLFFHRRVDDLVKSQPMLTIGLVAFFGPKQ